MHALKMLKLTNERLMNTASLSILNIFTHIQISLKKYISMIYINYAIKKNCEELTRVLVTPLTSLDLFSDMTS